MAVIVIGNTKGGVSKSTLSVQLAIARARQGKSVMLVNADRQKSSENAIGIRGDNAIEPFIALGSYPDGGVLKAQVLHQRDKYDDIFIDAGGRDSSALRAAMLIADVMLVPYAPTGFDVWAIEDEFVPIINDIQTVRGDNPLPIYALLSMADPKADSTDNAEAREVISSVKQMEFLDLPIVRRKAYSNASGQGLAVSEMRPRDRKACAEIDALLAALF